MTYFNVDKRVRLGATQSGKQLFLDPSVRTTHMHVLGASGRGKSYFLEHLIRQDIRNSDGLCLIDPHGALYEKVVSWCAEHDDRVSWEKMISSGAVPTTVETVCLEWVRTAEAPEFKAIQKIIK